jgi:hypothetical protein
MVKARMVENSLLLKHANQKAAQHWNLAFITENVACTAKLASIFKASFEASNTEI